MASAAARIGDRNLLLETAGVTFAFNTINRIADARRVKLECGLLRQWKPIRGWVERRLASLTSLAYDLSFKHHARQTPEELIDRLNVVFGRLGVKDVPNVFHWLSHSPVVLEGVLEMLEANFSSDGFRLNLLQETAAIAVSARATPGHCLSRAVDQWLPERSLPDLQRGDPSTTPSDADSAPGLELACRQYSWQVANAAYTITDEQILAMSKLGLVDAELLDLTIAASVFSALSIVESISVAVRPKTDCLDAEVVTKKGGQVRSGLPLEFAV